MRTSFLVNLRVQADLMHQRIHASLNAAGYTARPAGQWPFPKDAPVNYQQPASADSAGPAVSRKLPSENQAAFEARTGGARPAAVAGPLDFSDVANQSAKLLAMIDAEIARPMNSQEYEAQMLNTAPRQDETAEQTAYRLRAERADNPLVAQPIR